MMFDEGESKVGDKRKGGAGSGDGRESKGPRTRRAHDIPRDANGQPCMPLQLGSAMTILSLGAVKPGNPNFHNDKYVFPVGYKCIRQYNSTVDANAKCNYTCEILDGDAHARTHGLRVRINNGQTRQGFAGERCAERTSMACRDAGAYDTT